MKRRPPSESELVSAIKMAWDKASYPGDENIFTPHSYDDEGITEYFSGTNWYEHRAERLRAMSPAISVFFAPKAFHYWLPAFLIAAVEDPDELSQGLDTILSALSPNNYHSLSGEQAERLALLSQAQLDATINVIEWMGEKLGEDVSEILSFLHQTSRNANQG